MTRNALMDTADIMRLYEEPKPRNALMDLYSKTLPQGLGWLLGNVVARDRQAYADPVGRASDVAEAATAGIVSVPDDIARIFGAEIYGPETRQSLDESMGKDMLAALAAPFAVSGGNALMGAVLRAPKAATAGGAGIASIAGSASAGDEDGPSYTQRVMELETQRNELSGQIKDLFSRVDQLDAAAEAEGATGKGPRYRAKKAEADRARQEAQGRSGSLDAQLQAVNSSLDRLHAEYSPEAIRERQATSRIGELYPTETGMTQAALALTGLGADIVSRGRSRGQFNRAMDVANAGGSKAVGAAEKALKMGDASGAVRNASAARRYYDSAGALRDTSGMPWATIAGFESAAFAPDLIDYGRSSVTGNDELKGKVLEGVAGDPEDRNFMFEPLAQRLGLSGAGGYALGKLAKTTTGAVLPRRDIDGTIGPRLQAIEDDVSGLNLGRAQALAGNMAKGVTADRKAITARQSLDQLRQTDAELRQSLAGDAADVRLSAQLDGLRRSALLKQAKGERLTAAEQRLIGPPAQGSPPPAAPAQSQIPQPPPQPPSSPSPNNTAQPNMPPLKATSPGSVPPSPVQVPAGLGQRVDDYIARLPEQYRTDERAYGILVRDLEKSGIPAEQTIEAVRQRIRLLGGGAAAVSGATLTAPTFEDMLSEYAGLVRDMDGDGDVDADDLALMLQSQR